MLIRKFKESRKSEAEILPKTKEKREFPFRKSDGDVIWTLRDGEEIAISWEEFREMVKSKEYRQYIFFPKEEFEKYYKRMKLPVDVRDYHRESKRRNRAGRG
jgi:hypothetical protein